MGLGTSELLVILLLVMVLFGASKIPQLGRGLGEGLRNFKRGMNGESDGDPPRTSARADAPAAQPADSTRRSA
jgi:sec-independent protein translocase protein TatA